MLDDGLSPTERQQYLARIEALKQQNVVPSRGFLNLYGYTENGEFVIAPDSFALGYRHGLSPYSPRPSIVLNLLGLFGQLSNGIWVFLPTYNRGFSYGQSKQNDLKFAILAEGEKTLFQANADLTRRVTELENELNRLRNSQNQRTNER